MRSAPARVGEGHDAVGVADVEGVAHQRHAERLVLAFQEHVPCLGHAVAIASRSSVMRLALTPTAAARRIVLIMA